MFKPKSKEDKLNDVVEYLFKGVTLRDMEGTLDKLTPKQRKQLQADAEALRNNQVFILLYEELTKAAQRRMYLHAKEVDDLTFGKAMLYTLDLLEKSIRKLCM